MIERVLGDAQNPFVVRRTLISYEIMCANKNVQGVILRIGGDGWSLSLHEAVVKVINKELQLFIRVNGKSARVGIRGEGYDAYLVVESDGYPLHQLTDLPSC